jgi:hypothetical protein
LYDKITGLDRWHGVHQWATAIDFTSSLRPTEGNILARTNSRELLFEVDVLSLGIEDYSLVLFIERTIDAICAINESNMLIFSGIQFALEIRRDLGLRISYRDIGCAK